MYDEIIAIIEKLNEISKCTENTCSVSDEYNVFEVLGVEYKEVIMCRFLGNLLDCRGKHGLGTEPLRLFIRDVLHDEDFGGNLEEAIITLEDSTDNGRRVDIVIYLNSKIYPIEVKIWAGDQSKQLEDYYENYFGKSKDDKIYYLTPNGRSPSDKSMGGLDAEKGGQIVCISFSEDIKNWLDEVQNIEGASGSIKFVIGNFMEVIEKMAKDETELDTIKKNLELDNGECDSKAIKGAILLLKHRDELWNAIRKKYLSSILHCGDNFELCECGTKPESVSHIVLSVKKTDENGNKVECAWICVDTNLYIVTEKKDGQCDKGWESYNERFQWKYINDGNKHIQLKTPTPLNNDLKIYLTDYLQGV